MPVVLPPWARVTEKRLAHIARVGELVASWADAMAVAPAERERWLRAVSFHDALKDAPNALLLELAPDAWPSNGLRHGPAAAVMAARAGEHDAGVLAAVRYHSVGFAGWDAVGRMLYMADYLEPGRRRAPANRDALISRVPAEPGTVLREVARQRVRWTISKGHPLLPETVEFYNALTCGDSS